MFDQKILNQEYTISIDGKDLSGSYAGVNIANGPCCGGNKSAVVTAVPDDGLMDVLLFKGGSALRTALKEEGNMREIDRLLDELDKRSAGTAIEETVSTISDEVLMSEYQRTIKSINRAIDRIGTIDLIRNIDQIRNIDRIRNIDQIRQET
jgi:hypothetical protein